MRQERAIPRTLIRIHEAEARLYFVTSDFVRSAAEGEQILPLARFTGNEVKESEGWRPSPGDRPGDVTWMRRSAPLDRRWPWRTGGGAHGAGQGAFHDRVVRGVTGGLDERRAAMDSALAISHAAGDSIHRVACVDRGRAAAKLDRRLRRGGAAPDGGKALARDCVASLPAAVRLLSAGVSRCVAGVTTTLPSRRSRKACRWLSVLVTKPFVIAF